MQQQQQNKNEENTNLPHEVIIPLTVSGVEQREESFKPNSEGSIYQKNQAKQQQQSTPNSGMSITTTQNVNPQNQNNNNYPKLGPAGFFFIGTNFDNNEKNNRNYHDDDDEQDVGDEFEDFATFHSSTFNNNNNGEGATTTTISAKKNNNNNNNNIQQAKKNNNTRNKTKVSRKVLSRNIPNNNNSNNNSDNLDYHDLFFRGSSSSKNKDSDNMNKDTDDDDFFDDDDDDEYTDMDNFGFETDSPSENDDVNHDENNKKTAVSNNKNNRNKKLIEENHPLNQFPTFQQMVDKHRSDANITLASSNKTDNNSNNNADDKTQKKRNRKTKTNNNNGYDDQEENEMGTSLGIIATFADGKHVEEQPNKKLLDKLHNNNQDQNNNENGSNAKMSSSSQRQGNKKKNDNNSDSGGSSLASLPDDMLEEGDGSIINPAVFGKSQNNQQQNNNKNSADMNASATVSRKNAREIIIKQRRQSESNLHHQTNEEEDISEMMLSSPTTNHNNNKNNMNGSNSHRENSSPSVKINVPPSSFTDNAVENEKQQKNEEEKNKNIHNKNNNDGKKNDDENDGNNNNNLAGMTRDERNIARFGAHPMVAPCLQHFFFHSILRDEDSFSDYVRKIIFVGMVSSIPSLMLIFAWWFASGAAEGLLPNSAGESTSSMIIGALGLGGTIPTFIIAFIHVKKTRKLSQNVLIAVYYMMTSIQMSFSVLYPYNPTEDWHFLVSCLYLVFLQESSQQRALWSMRTLNDDVLHDRTEEIDMQEAGAEAELEEATNKARIQQYVMNNTSNKNPESVETSLNRDQNQNQEENLMKISNSRDSNESNNNNRFGGGGAAAAAKSSSSFRSLHNNQNNNNDSKDSPSGSHELSRNSMGRNSSSIATNAVNNNNNHHNHNNNTLHNTIYQNTKYVIDLDAIGKRDFTSVAAEVGADDDYEENENNINRSNEVDEDDNNHGDRKHKSSADEKKKRSKLTANENNNNNEEEDLAGSQVLSIAAASDRQVSEMDFKDDDDDGDGDGDDDGKENRFDRLQRKKRQTKRKKDDIEKRRPSWIHVILTSVFFLVASYNRQFAGRPQMLNPDNTSMTSTLQEFLHDDGDAYLRDQGIANRYGEHTDWKSYHHSVLVYFWHRNGNAWEGLVSAIMIGVTLFMSCSTWLLIHQHVFRIFKQAEEYPKLFEKVADRLDDFDLEGLRTVLKDYSQQRNSNRLVFKGLVNVFASLTWYSSFVSDHFFRALLHQRLVLEKLQRKYRKQRQQQQQQVEASGVEDQAANPNGNSAPPAPLLSKTFTTTLFVRIRDFDLLTDFVDFHCKKIFQNQKQNMQQQQQGGDEDIKIKNSNNNKRSSSSLSKEQQQQQHDLRTFGQTNLALSHEEARLKRRLFSALVSRFYTVVQRRVEQHFGSVLELGDHNGEIVATFCTRSHRQELQRQQKEFYDKPKKASTDKNTSENNTNNNNYQFHTCAAAASVSSSPPPHVPPPPPPPPVLSSPSPSTTHPSPNFHVPSSTIKLATKLDIANDAVLAACSALHILSSVQDLFTNEFNELLASFIASENKNSNNSNENKNNNNNSAGFIPPTFDIRIGIHQDETTVGLYGSLGLQTFTAFGPSVSAAKALTMIDKVFPKCTICLTSEVLKSLVFHRQQAELEHHHSVLRVQKEKRERSSNVGITIPPAVATKPNNNNNNNNGKAAAVRLFSATTNNNNNNMNSSPTASPISQLISESNPTSAAVDDEEEDDGRDASSHVPPPFLRAIRKKLIKLPHDLVFVTRELTFGRIKQFGEWHSGIHQLVGLHSKVRRGLEDSLALQKGASSSMMMMMVPGSSAQASADFKQNQKARLEWYKKARQIQQNRQFDVPVGLPGDSLVTATASEVDFDGSLQSSSSMINDDNMLINNSALIMSSNLGMLESSSGGDGGGNNSSSNNSISSSPQKLIVPQRGDHKNNQHVIHNNKFANQNDTLNKFDDSAASGMDSSSVQRRRSGAQKFTCYDENKFDENTYRQLVDGDDGTNMLFKNNNGNNNNNNENHQLLQQSFDQSPEVLKLHQKFFSLQQDLFREVQLSQQNNNNNNLNDDDNNEKNQHRENSSHGNSIVDELMNAAKHNADPHIQRLLGQFEELKKQIDVRFQQHELAFNKKLADDAEKKKKKQKEEYETFVFYTNDKKEVAGGISYHLLPAASNTSATIINRPGTTSSDEQDEEVIVSMIRKSNDSARNKAEETSKKKVNVGEEAEKASASSSSSKSPTFPSSFSSTSSPSNQKNSFYEYNHFDEIALLIGRSLKALRRRYLLSIPSYEIVRALNSAYRKAMLQRQYRRAVLVLDELVLGANALDRQWDRLLVDGGITAEVGTTLRAKCLYYLKFPPPMGLCEAVELSDCV